MTQHILVFVDKKGKEVDRIYMNGPVNGAWEMEVLNNFKSNFPEKWLSVLRYQNMSETEALRSLKRTDLVFHPFARYADENEVCFRIYIGEDYKKYGAVTLVYTKESGWATDKDEKDLIDSKKNYDYVIWGYNDIGEFDKGTNLYKKLMEFVKSAINIHRRKIG